MHTSESTYKGGEDHSKSRICIITSNWHADIVENMYVGADDVLRSHGVSSIKRHSVPGSFELPFVARMILDTGHFDAIICLGVIIKGETNHDEIIGQVVAQQISNLSIVSKIPILLGVLTTFTKEQAIARSNGTHGHKGRECAVAALELLDLKAGLKSTGNSTGFKVV